MPDLLDIVGNLAAIFDRLQIRYAVGGAIANNHWGVVRTTQDVDCLVAVPSLTYQRFSDELNVLGCSINPLPPTVPISVAELVKQTRDRNFFECFYESIRIELFVPAVSLQYEILRRAIEIKLGGQNIRVTTAEDLVLLKMAFHRAKDLQDIRGILWVQRGRLDIDYINSWSANVLDDSSQIELQRLIETYSRTDQDTT